jgi:hypothetical protein
MLPRSRLTRVPIVITAMAAAFAAAFAAGAASSGPRPAKALSPTPIELEDVAIRVPRFQPGRPLPELAPRPRRAHRRAADEPGAVDARRPAGGGDSPAPRAAGDGPAPTRTADRSRPVRSERQPDDGSLSPAPAAEEPSLSPPPAAVPPPADEPEDPDAEAPPEDDLAEADAG